MVFKCPKRATHLFIALLSIFISMAGIVCVDRLPQELKQDQLIVNHICLLQIIASVLLIVGSLKHWFFVPWLLIAALFAYTLIYKSIGYWLSAWIGIRASLTIVCLLYIIAGFWLYYIYAVYQDFRNSAAQTSMDDSILLKRMVSNIDSIDGDFENSFNIQNC
ncbi:hypothetical protein AWZ03_002065 [Drosophila navojoa]|uniref:Uncharacterized protein n=1 Tax=Drosophila navojoa TaxID=7232 RepID=A0A484BUQ0_DRONA|nr:hypothetical protein AWZ03_002065 [Drosophila navojoa]